MSSLVEALQHAPDVQSCLGAARQLSERAARGHVSASVAVKVGDTKMFFSFFFFIFTSAPAHSARRSFCTLLLVP